MLLVLLVLADESELEAMTLATNPGMSSSTPSLNAAPIALLPITRGTSASLTRPSDTMLPAVELFLYLELLQIVIILSTIVAVPLLLLLMLLPAIDLLWLVAGMRGIARGGEMDALNAFTPYSIPAVNMSPSALVTGAVVLVGRGWNEAAALAAVMVPLLKLLVLLANALAGGELGEAGAFVFTLYTIPVVIISLSVLVTGVVVAGPGNEATELATFTTPSLKLLVVLLLNVLSGGGGETDEFLLLYDIISATISLVKGSGAGDGKKEILLPLSGDSTIPLGEADAGLSTEREVKNDPWLLTDERLLVLLAPAPVPVVAIVAGGVVAMFVVVFVVLVVVVVVARFALCSNASGRSRMCATSTKSGSVTMFALFAWNPGALLSLSCAPASSPRMLRVGELLLDISVNRFFLACCGREEARARGPAPAWLLGW